MEGMMSKTRSSEEIFEELVQALVEERIEGEEIEIDSMKFHEMELLGHGLGKELAGRVQQALVARQGEQMPRVFRCPKCGQECASVRKPKAIQSLDGEFELTEVRCHCRKCRRSFFPSA
jgi:hypothetical protein